MNNSFIFNNQTIYFRLNLLYLKISKKFNIYKILNNQFIYQKILDYKIFIKINEKIVKFNKLNNIKITTNYFKKNLNLIFNKQQKLGKNLKKIIKI